MPLLPHKSWNDWTKKNKDKVNKDEEKNKEEEEKKRKRQMDIEQERRYEVLKSRIKRNKIDDNEEKELDSGQSSELNSSNSKHINLFAELEEAEEREKIMAIASGGTKREVKKEAEKNKEYEEEKKAKDDRYTVYLGGGSESDKTKPWYANSQGNEKAKVVELNTTEKEKQRKIEKRKESIDPLNEMKQHLSQKKKKEKHHEKSKSSDSSKKSIEEMRKERLEREKMERERVNMILYGTMPEKSSNSGSKITSD